ncbi:MAG: hypothetical protein RMM06_07490, partial [Armatimonadota bacterium]|nr:hypothetical protein [Armatimonadota bacterium]
MYAIWLPQRSSPSWQRADSGATIGGTFQVRVVVRPDNGYLYGGPSNVSVVATSITEIADHHAGPTHMGNLAVVSPNAAYGDPTTGSVAVLQSEYLFLPHNATYRLRVRVRYLVIPPFPPRFVEEEGEMLLTIRNLQIVDSRPEPCFVWTPEQMGGVPFSAQLLCAQQATCTVQLEIFSSEDNQNPVLVRQFENVSRPGSWSWTWDGRLADGSTAPAGVYSYRLSARSEPMPWMDFDCTISSFLHLERAYDSNNQPILEAEYWDYDDGGTVEDETDDHYLYFVRWYVLRGTRNASRGQLWLFGPGWQRVGVWDLSQLPCVEHGNQPDGLVAAPSGMRHGVIVRVPVS